MYMSLKAFIMRLVSRRWVSIDSSRCVRHCRRLRATQSSSKTPIWLDCDPGHDDALAIILAGYHSDAQLLGISTVFGNQRLECVTTNACIVVHSAGLHTEVHKGQAEPLLRPPIYAPQIHGETGLDTLEDDSGFIIDNAALAVRSEGLRSHYHAIDAMYSCISKWIEMNPDAHVYLVCTAALTNVALLLKLHPELIQHLRMVLMGGCIGVGNVNPVVEFNFQTDPEAAKIVFQSGVHLTMIPLEVTHTALATDEILTRLRGPSRFKSFIRQLLQFFSQTYKDVYHFDHPPVHDPCAVLCALEPHLFQVIQSSTLSHSHRCVQLDFMHVDIETTSPLSAGQSVCDIWGQSEDTPNCYVGRSMDTDVFWDRMIDAIEAADARSPLNGS